MDVSIKIKLFLYIFFLWVLFPEKSFAYLDPGTGSYVFQLLIAGLLGSTFFMKSIIKKGKETFRSFLPKSTDKNHDEQV